MDDAVDLSMTASSGGISQATVRDLQALTQNSGLTITRARPPPAASNLTLPNQPASAPQQSNDNGAPNQAQDNGKEVKLSSQ